MSGARQQRRQREHAGAQRGRARVEHAPQADHHDEGDEPGDGQRSAPPQHVAPPPAVGDHRRQHEADEQLAGAGLGAVVRAVDARASSTTGRANDTRARAPATMPRWRAGRVERRAQQHGAEPDDEVELLLDRQAPEVEHRRRAAEEVAVGVVLEQEVPVGDLQPGGDDVAARRRREHRRRDAHDGDDGEQQPTPPAATGGRAADQNARQREAAAAGDLVEDDRADHRRRRW